MRTPVQNTYYHFIIVPASCPEEGLDPHLSKGGLFGKGTYLAEDAAKIDQYLKQDPEWRGNKPDHELQKLYGSTPPMSTMPGQGPPSAGPPPPGSLSRRLQSAPAFRTFSVHK